MQDFELTYACGTSVIVNDTMLDQFTEQQVQNLQEYASQNKLADIENNNVDPLKFKLEDFQKLAVIDNKDIIFEDIQADEIHFTEHAYDRYAERVEEIPPTQFRGYSYPEKTDKIDKIIDFINDSQMIETKAEYKGERVVRYNFIGELEGKSVVISVKFEEFVVVITIIDKKNPQ
ncbi:hypothetical protein [Peribacillus frigoritolerans]|uniref:hypothetical protein n=1 Tax=Peribacillus frigoritolerans TaxID=450367 RepID=UPI001E0994CB|nr:hypothetical protein [Listeria monocytogenes]